MIFDYFLRNEEKMKKIKENIEINRFVTWFFSFIDAISFPINLIR